MSFVGHQARYLRVSGVKGASRRGLSLREVRVGPSTVMAATQRISASARQVCERRASRVKRSRSRAVRLTCLQRAHLRAASRSGRMF